MKNSIYILAILLLAFYACEEPISVELDNANTNRLVIEGSITNEHKIHSVTLSRTDAFLSSERTPRALNANVLITDGDTIINLYDADNDGTYETEHELAGKVGHAYTLEITLEDGTVYNATDTMYSVAPFDSINYEYKKSNIPFSEKYVYNINIYVQEPPQQNQFYQWEMYFDGVHQTDTVNTKRFESDEIVNGTYFNGWTVFEIEEERVDKEEVEVTLQMLSISEPKFDFLLAILFETDFSGSMFSGPPANVPGNMSNGALGFFSASAVTQETITIKRVREVP